MGLQLFSSPNLPAPPPTYDHSYFRHLIRSIGTYFSQLDSKTPIHADIFYGGQFYASSKAFTSDGNLATNEMIALVDATSADTTITLPLASESVGRLIKIKKTDASANSVIADGHGSETIDGSTTKSTSTAYDYFTLYCDGTEWWTV